MHRVMAILLTPRGLLVASLLTLLTLVAWGASIALSPRIAFMDGVRETYVDKSNGETSLIEIDTSTDGKPPSHLARIATTRMIAGHAGFVLQDSGRGRSVKYQGSWPRFVSETPFEIAVERIIQAEVELSARNSTSEVWEDWEEFWWTIREPSFCNQWEYEDNWQITFHNSRLISLLCGRYYFTGGAHPNYHFENRTFWWNGDRAVAVNLVDFFEPKTDWQATLCNLCSIDLQQQKGVDSPVEMAPDDLNCFTVDPDGIQLHFAPYEKGCYAEGAFEVHVPFTTVQHLLRASGPVKALGLPSSVARRDSR